MSHADTSKLRIDPHDFLAISDQLDGQEKMIRDTVRSWVDKEIAPNIGEWFEEGHLPKSLAKDMGGLGLLGMHLEGYGCAGTSAVEYGLAALELEAGDTGVRSFMSVQGSLAMFPIWAYGSEEQKQQWLPGMAAGDLVGCFGLTEPDSGSDAANMRTHAKQDAGGDWILNGTKMWITNGNIADVAVVWARADDGTVRGFVVPTDTPGFTANPIKHKMSLRASNTAELVLEDVRLPADAVLPGVASMRGPLSCLSEARFGILWGVMGAARSCYEASLAYTGEREAFGGPISRFQITQQRLVEMMVRVEKGTLLALHLGRMKDAGTLAPAQVSFGKMDNTREALAVAREARSLHGANGITLEYVPIRHLLNLETVLTYEGTNEIHQLIMGQAITGHAAFS
ncbi:MAG TPA: acyl-CoA dehydrogenase family protein [Acidimicrobiia bacterium]|nr:acyl-CoA dehydrogenase family protein [Acidimicrobiia bacterium]